MDESNIEKHKVQVKELYWLYFSCFCSGAFTENFHFAVYQMLHSAVFVFG